MIKATGRYYLYRHVRLDKNEPFYIGVGTKGKKMAHSTAMSAYSRAYKTESRTNYWYNITEKVPYEVEVLLESDDKEFIYNKEVEFISLYGRMDLGTGPLVNLVTGGKSFKMSKESVDRRVETKRKRGQLNNAKNLTEWINSPEYKNPKARKIFLYSINTGFIKQFDSVQSCADYFGLKGSVSWIMTQCDKRMIYRNEYVLSWTHLGDKVNVSEFNPEKMFFQGVNMVCPKTKAVLMSFEKMSDAARYIDTDLRNISTAVARKHKCGGYVWEKSFSLNQQKES